MQLGFIGAVEILERWVSGCYELRASWEVIG
jgi:hypothetical protein